ncbi:MAG TPA: SIMPL domain-containing protein [Candidatus Limnocylindria bacterium]|nr:SIMPL domain-containing protein [Candidatus Limnocylindria bacterium]
MARKDRFISVSATGEATMAPDLALVSFAVTGSGKELGPTRDDVLTRSSAVLARLRELGITDADLNAPDVAVHPEYDYRRGQQLVGYRVSRHMTVRVRSLDALGPVLDGIVAAGANEVGGAQMTASDPSVAEQAALRAAVASARTKAEALAAEAGVTLGEIIRIEEEAAGGMVPRPRFMAAKGAIETADASTEIAAGDLTVSRTVRAWFAIG